MYAEHKVQVTTKRNATSQTSKRSPQFLGCSFGHERRPNAGRQRRTKSPQPSPWAVGTDRQGVRHYVRSSGYHDKRLRAVAGVDGAQEGKLSCVVWVIANAVGWHALVAEHVPRFKQFAS